MKSENKYFYLYKCYLCSISAQNKSNENFWVLPSQKIHYISTAYLSTSTVCSQYMKRKLTQQLLQSM